MELNVYTLFNRVDGSAQALTLARSESRLIRSILDDNSRRNAELKQKNYPPIDLSEYELRRIGTFEDTTCVITPCVPPVVVPLFDSKD